MKRKLFRHIFSGTMAVFTACFILTMWAVYGYFSDRNHQQLEEEAAYLAAAVAQDGADFLNGIEPSQLQRITWIDADGTVLYDSLVDPSEMGNHGQRDEVVQAHANGSGWSVRYSDTLSVKTTNYALLLPDDTVFRLSSSESTVFSLIVGMWPGIVCVILLAVALSALLAGLLASRLLLPVNEIDLEHPDEKKVYPELRPLVRRIREQNQQLQQQMELLVEEHQRQDRIRREFTANVSHELKTPLTSISGYAELIREGIARPEDIPRFSGKIYDEAQRLQTLVGDIIQLSRLEETGTVPDKEPVELLALCRKIAEEYQPQAAARGISLAVDGEEQTVQGTPSLLREMVSNLCDNAVKYNRDGGSVTLSVCRAGDQVVLTVRDTGIGIPEADQDRVFERFYRVDKSHSKAVGGTGLGLSIVKHGAVRLDAQIRLESRLGQGTEIALCFPADTEHSE